MRGKKVVLVLLAIGILFAFSGCGCEHDWQEANCTEPKTCLICGKQQGLVEMHLYRDATCTQPATCSSCGETSGEPSDHNYIDGYCYMCGVEDPTIVRLSSSCDRILATGYDADDNFYELVANETEDYTGLVISVGAIKNNEWILEPTNTMPFVTEENLISENGPETGKVYYIGNGCFLSEKSTKTQNAYAKRYTYVIYNANNDLSYSTAGYDQLYKRKIPIPSADNEEYMIIGYSGSPTAFTILNKTDMSTSQVAVEGRVQEITNISEGLFSVGVGDEIYPDYYVYDYNGNLVLDLSEYKTLNSDNSVYFSGGKCELIVKNNNDTEYRITIDREGNVLDSVELS